MKGGMILSRYSLLRDQSKARDGRRDRSCSRRRSRGACHRHRRTKRR